jgi:preprotein translocase subunit SecG
MTIFLSIIHYIVCLVLIIVILLQAGRGHGLAGGGFGGDTASSIFGTKTGNLLTKLTTFAAIAFIITSLSIDVLNSRKQKSLIMNSKELVLPQELADLAAKKDGVTVKKIMNDDGTTKQVVTEYQKENVIDPEEVDKTAQKIAETANANVQ